MIRATITLATILATSAVASAAPTASDVVDSIQKYYVKVDHVQAKFRQVVTNEMTGTSKQSDGKVWILKPGKMRWDYSEKIRGADMVKKSFISNGSQLWVVEHDNKQIIKKSLQQDVMPVAVSFLYGRGSLKDEFNPEIDTKMKLGGGSDIVLKLTPKKPSAQYKNLYLVVNPTDFHVSQSEIVDASNNTNHISFFEPNTSSAVDTTWFEYNEKEATKSGYRVVDADQQPAGSNTPAGATDLGPPPALPKKP